MGGQERGHRIHDMQEKERIQYAVTGGCDEN
jgi:hypothetical protein